MKQVTVSCAKCCRFWIILAIVLMAVTLPAGAQKKNKNKSTAASDATEEIKSSMPMTDSQAIDQVVGEALGYWQIGDVESLHKYYADDVVVVSGAWEPPVIGWDNYVKAYQVQRARVSGTHMDRSNTFIKVNGNTAWATYQFTYAAQMGGQLIQSRGHTTLGLVKQGNRWLIVLNHSSVVDSSVPVPAAPMDPAQPGGNR
jgi:ketosteroid isomerase-like protein